MARFELRYQHEVDYDQRITLEIKLEKRPSAEKYKLMREAIEKLDEIRVAYLPDKPKEVKK